MRMRQIALAGLAAACASFAQTETAQTPTPAQTPAPAPDKPSTWSVGPIKFSGLIDGYFSKNFNNPASRFNQLRNFDVKSNQFSLNMTKITLAHDPDPVGFTLDFGFGRAWNIFHATEPSGATEFLQYLPQAFVSVKPPNAGGFQFDFGKFYTSAGAELTETHLNWNYSRALLYANGPYYHFGARMVKPLGDHFSAGFQVVNGWNNVEDNNSPKTVGFTAAATSSKVSWYNTYYVGTETSLDGAIEGNRHFYDTVLSLTPSDKFNAYVNFDYGQQHDKFAQTDYAFYGVALAAKVAPTGWFALSPRIEWYKDRDGFITGTAQSLKEFTMTGEFKMKEGFLTRLEYRRDWSDVPYFDRGNTPASAKSQSTILVGIVAFFGPER